MIVCTLLLVLFQLMGLKEGAPTTTKVQKAGGKSGHAAKLVSWCRYLQPYPAYTFAITRFPFYITNCSFFVHALLLQVSKDIQQRLKDEWARVLTPATGLHNYSEMKKAVEEENKHRLQQFLESDDSNGNQS